MVEYNIFGTSPWNSDPFLCKDLNPFPGLDCQGVLDMGIAGQENPERVVCNQDGNGQNQSSLISTIPRNDEFWASCDDDLMTTITSDSLGFESLNWTSEAGTESSWNSDSSCDIVTNIPSIQNHCKRQSSADPLTEGKSWSRMTAEEQLGTVEALTEIISHQMGLREQLEVIKIIDPVAVISSADTEFVIDLACLDDRKLQRIRNYVQHHALELTSHCRSGNAVNIAPSISSESSNSSSSSSSTSSRSSVNLDDYYVTNPTPLKKQIGECKQLKAWQQRQHRQKLKEKRSGLFVREEIVSLTATAPEPEIDDTEDIDILA